MMMAMMMMSTALKLDSQAGNEAFRRCRPYAATRPLKNRTPVIRQPGLHVQVANARHSALTVHFWKFYLMKIISAVWLQQPETITFQVSLLDFARLSSADWNCTHYLYFAVTSCCQKYFISL